MSQDDCLCSGSRSPNPPFEMPHVGLKLTFWLYDMLVTLC